MKILLSALVVLVIIIGTVVGSYVGNYNYGNRAEQTIVAEYTNMENILAQYGLEVSEAAQIPSMQKDDLKELFEGSIKARYGESGSNASFQWLKEQNPDLNQETYVKLQIIISAGRQKYTNAQTKFIDTKRVYETNLGYLWKGLWLGVAGYPKIDLDEYVIISSTKAKEAFETKIDTGIQLR